jgi:uncharacterized protein with HEPN domain
MNRSIALFIRDIIENMDRAEAFTHGMSYEEFAADAKTSYAAVRCLEIIGEAAKHVPLSTRRKYPEIPWKKMAGMRDKVIHFYFGINFKAVWLTIKDDIPRLRPLLEKVREDLKEKE